MLWGIPSLAHVVNMIKSSKIKKIEAEMNSVSSYEEWHALAHQHDEASGMKRWRDVDRSSAYDYVQIRRRLDRLRELRSRHDDAGLLFTLNEGIHGNLGGMGRSALYTYSKFGTKKLIVEYIDEVVAALVHISQMENETISFADKLDFFHRASHCFGRSAGRSVMVR